MAESLIKHRMAPSLSFIHHSYELAEFVITKLEIFNVHGPNFAYADVC